MSKPTILVTGATGQQGGAVCKYLAESGQVDIVAVSRDPSSEASKRLASLPHTRVIKGDLAHPQPLFNTKVDRLFLMCPTFTPNEAQVCMALLDAAVSSGVTYIVYSGVDLCGVDEVGIETFDVKRTIWKHLKSLEVESTYIGPSGFLETLFWPRFPQMTQAWPRGYVHKYVCTDDIGHVAALALQSPKAYAGREIMLAGEAVTAPQFKQIWERVVGKELGIEEPDNDYVRDMFIQLGKYPFAADVEACRAEFPFMSDLKTWLREVYVPATSK